MEVVFAAIAIPAAVVSGVSLLGILFRRNPREAPTWAAYGVVAGLVGFVAATVVLLVEIVIK
jgi:FtsH-binding integral membrane protein